MNGPPARRARSEPALDGRTGQGTVEDVADSAAGEPGATACTAATWADVARLILAGEIEFNEPPGYGPSARRRRGASAGSNNGFLTGDARLRASAIEIAETCHKIPTLQPLWIRCGKPTCRCAEGRPHGPFWSLRWRDGATQRRRYVRQRDVAAVRAVIEQRHADRAAVRALFADDLALLRRLSYLRRELEAAVAAERRDR